MSINRQFEVCRKCRNLRMESRDPNSHVLLCGLVYDSADFNNRDVPYDPVKFRRLEQRARESLIQKLEGWIVPEECTMEPYATYRKLREL